jgi:hypothetical protein
LEYVTIHANDEQSILDTNPKQAKLMQIAIISTIHKLKRDEFNVSAENGEIDVNLELMKDRKKLRIIKDLALPEFLKAVFHHSMVD